MKAQIIRFAGSLTLATALLTTTTAAFAAPPSNLNPTVYDEGDARAEGDATAAGLELGGAGLGVGAGVVNTAAGDTPGGAATAAGLGAGGTVLTNIAAPAVRFGTR